jgi:hypothetical protein
VGEAFAPRPPPPVDTARELMVALFRFSVFTLVLGGVSMLFANCAGTAADENFRRKVSAVEVSAAIAADEAGQYGGNAGAKFTFRDPGAKVRDNK